MFPLVKYILKQSLTDVSSKFIKWPSTSKEKIATKKGLYAIARFLAVIGAVDGTHFGIIAPPKHDLVLLTAKDFIP